MLGLLFIIRIVLENVMSRVCQVTGKRPVSGYKYAIRGIAKKKKGIGLKVTGKTKRRFLPNLVKKRLWFGEENRFVTLCLSMKALRTIDKRGVGVVVREMRAEGIDV
jgi:large subunit ribosomal protein L28